LRCRIRVPPKTIKVKQKQSTTWITLNRPNKLNAMNATMLNELSEALDTTEKNSETRCVIITGEGERAFSAGADINELQKLTPQTAREFSRKGQQTFSKVEALSKPVVAAINGYALGGGLELALACDFRIGSHHAKLGFPEIKLGIIPGWGGTQRLAWAVGAAEAKRLIMLGDMVKAEEAARLGLVNKIVPQKKLEAESEVLAQRLSRCLSTALKNVKYAINPITQSYLEPGLEKETDLFAQLFSQRETKERLQAFLSKRNKKETETAS
jgi:enoyl-CoA hydratase/carnithine racemase